MFGAWICGIYFYKFWRQSQDRLFILFAIAFWIMALERLVLVLIATPSEEVRSAVYLFRLLAFIIILFAIVDKNRKERPTL